MESKLADRISGFVAKLNAKDGKGKNPPYKPYTLYSIRLELENGTEYPDWIGFGFDKPPFNEGDYISIEVEKVNGRVQFIKDSGQRPKNPPARAAKADSGNNAKGGPGRAGGYSPNKFDGTGIQNKANPEDVKRISYANGRDHAIKVVELLLANKALPVSNGDTKSNVAKRYDEIVAAIDKLTIQYANDAVSLRLHGVVADAGESRVDTKADGPIPDPAKKEKAKSVSKQQAEEEAAAQDGNGDDSGSGVPGSDDDAF